MKSIIEILCFELIYTLVLAQYALKKKNEQVSSRTSWIGILIFYSINIVISFESLLYKLSLYT
jgi:hypothetical protein